MEADGRTAKAAIYGLNRAGGRTRELEEAWIIQALVREDGSRGFWAIPNSLTGRVFLAGRWCAGAPPPALGLNSPKPTSRVHHQAMPPEAFGALLPLIEPHADTGAHGCKDGISLCARHKSIMG